jgi:transcriptional regulator with XRE-family HTH domain
MRPKSPKKYNLALAAVIADARKSAGISQRRLSDMLGRPNAYIAKLETGRKMAHAYDLHAIGRILGIEPAELMERVERRL